MATLNKLVYSNSQPKSAANSIKVLAEHFNPAVDQINTNTQAIEDLTVFAERNSSNTKVGYEVVTAEIALTNANLKAMYGAAVTLLAAPATGTFYEIIGGSIRYTHATAAHTGGGAIALYINSVIVTTTIPATLLTTAADGVATIAPISAIIATGTNGAIKIGNASAAFVGATAAGTAVVHLIYRIHRV